MHIVIDRDKEINKLREMLNVLTDEKDIQSVNFAINLLENTGTPLPKGHGRLIDLSKLYDDMIDSDNPIIYLTINGEDIEAISLDYLEDLPTIIPEDKDAENV